MVLVNIASFDFGPCKKKKLLQKILSFKKAHGSTFSLRCHGLAHVAVVGRATFATWH